MDQQIHNSVPIKDDDSSSVMPAILNDTIPLLPPRSPGRLPSPGMRSNASPSPTDSFPAADQSLLSSRRLVTSSKASLKDLNPTSNDTSPSVDGEVKHFTKGESRRTDPIDAQASPEGPVIPDFSSEKEVVPASSTSAHEATSGITKHSPTRGLARPAITRDDTNEDNRNSIISGIGETYEPTSSAEDKKRWSTVSPVQESFDMPEKRKSILLQELQGSSTHAVPHSPNKGEMETFYDSSSETSLERDQNLGGEGGGEHEDEREEFDGAITRSDEGVMLAAANSVRMNRQSRVSSPDIRNIEEFFAAREKARGGDMWERVGRASVRKRLGKAEKVLGEESIGNGSGKAGRVLGPEAMMRGKRSSAANSIGDKSGLSAGLQSPWLQGINMPAEVTKDGASRNRSGSQRRSKGMSMLDALHSNPPGSTAPVSRRSSEISAAGRRTRFAPDPLNLHGREGGAKLERESVVTTPYPKAGIEDRFLGEAEDAVGLRLNDRDEETGVLGRADKGSVDWRKRFSTISSLGRDDGRKRFSVFSFTRREREKTYGSVREEPDTREQIDEAPIDAVLTILLYRPRTTVPRVGTVVVPKDRKILGSDHMEKKSRGKRSGAQAPRTFDDEGLFQLMRSQYFQLRGGILSRILNARGLKSISLLSYTHVSQLVTRNENPIKRKTFRTVSGMFAEERMLELVRSPRKGKGQSEWVEWVVRLVENNDSHVDSDEKAEDKEKIAVEFIEGLDGRKVALALTMVVALSTLAMLLWIFLGTGGQQEQNLGFHGYGIPGEIGYRGAGGRVETGVLLGILILLIGLTGVAAWIGLSWFAM